MHGVYVGVTTTTITRVHLYQLGSTNTTTRERAQVQPMSSFIEGFGIQHVLDCDAVQNESTRNHSRQQAGVKKAPLGLWAGHSSWLFVFFFFLEI